MKKDMMDVLCCPMCKKALTLKIHEQQNDEVLSGTLVCSSCQISYEISEGIPNLLPRQ